MKQHVLLWSQSQCSFHIEAVAAMLIANRRQFHGDRQTDSVPIFFGSEDTCHAAADILRPVLIERRAKMIDDALTQLSEEKVFQQ